LEFATQIDCILFCRAAKVWNLPTKATQVDCFRCAARIFGICNSNGQHFVLPRSENLGICQEKQLKFTVFCSAAQRKTLGFANKSNSNCLYFGLPRRQIFWNLDKTAFCSAAQPKFWNLSTKTTQIDCILLPRIEFFWNLQQKQLKCEYFWNLQLKLTAFCFAEQRKFRSLPTKATQVDCFGRQREFLEFASQIDSVLFAAQRKFGICQQKQLKLTVFCSATPTSTHTPHPYSTDPLVWANLYCEIAMFLNNHCQKRKSNERLRIGFRRDNCSELMGHDVSVSYIWLISSHFDRKIL
jgi:hypothetical protein